MLMDDGQVELPSDYMEPYVITRRMIEDGRKQLVLRDTLALPFPTRLLEHAQGPDMQLQLVKDADHRFSDDRCLSLVSDALTQVIALAS